MKKALRFVQFLFFIICIAFLLYAFFQEKEVIEELFENSTKIFLVVAILLWPITVLLSGLFAWIVLGGKKSGVSFTEVLGIYMNRLPAKYLPGGIWHTVARAYDFNSLGLSKSNIGVLVFYENFWTVLIAAFVSGFYVFVMNHDPIFKSLAAAMIAGSLVFIVLAFMFRKNNFVLNKTTYIGISLTGICFWMLAGSIFILYLIAIGMQSENMNIFALFFHYLFSYVVGFVSIFTPQGIGVFEVVMMQLTVFKMSDTQVLILLAGFRIIVLCGDIITWLLYVLSRKILDKNQEVSHG